MGSYDGWVTDGIVATTQDDTVWIQQHSTFSPFVWLGTCARLDEGSDALGDVTVTQKRNPRGGLSRHSVLAGAPGETTDTLTIKRLQYDRKKSDLRNCWWNVDQRRMCGGIDADAWNAWEEIIRRCYGKATERGIPATSYEGDNEEQLFSFGFTSLYSEDIYRVTGEIGPAVATGASGGDVMLLDVTSCQPERCPGPCDDQQDCVVVAIGEDQGGASVYLYTNLHGGDLDEWETVELTDLDGDDPTQVACAGSFVIVTSTAAASIVRSDDLGETQVEETTTDMTAHAPSSVDMIDQSFIVVGGADGYIYGSYDAGRNWTTLDAGNATTNTIDRIMICRSDPMTIYGTCSAADVVVKSENGGKTWYTTEVTATGGTGPTALCVVDRNHVLVGTDAGEIFQTSDGGDTWDEQSDLDGIGTKANVTIVDIVGCGCGVLGLIAENDGEGEEGNYFYRNVDNGADGRWFQPDEYEAVASGKSLTGLTCCSANHFVAVGGETATDNLVLLLE